MPEPQFISDRAVTLQPSLTLAISAKAKKLRAEGRDICSLSAGEPDFETPSYIVEAAVKALRDGVTRYGPAAGDPELRIAIAQKLTEWNQISTIPEQILITNGGKQAIFNLFQVLLNPGDEVLIPSPYWLSYPEIVKLAGGIPIPINTCSANDFEIDINTLEKAITNKTRVFIINTPGNPSGKVTSLEELKRIAELLRKYPQILILSDEIYELLVDSNYAHHSFAAVAPDLKNRIFTVNGFAKGWAMTGWRVGYLSGQEDVIKAAIALQSQSTSNVCSFAQRGALAALKGPKQAIQEMIISYNSRRELLSNQLNQIEGINLVFPHGAFYAFPELPINCPNSIDFCQKALDEVGLALIPGAAFGEDRFVRVSCSASKEAIKDGMNRLKIFLASF